MLVSPPVTLTTMHNPFEAKANKELAERVSRLRKVLDAGLEALASPLSFEARPVGATEAGAGLAPVLRFLEVTRSAGSQKEILGALLDVAACCYPRAVLFILRSGALVAWDTRDTRGAGESRVGNVAHMTIPAQGEHLPALALASGTLVSGGAGGPGFLLTELLGGIVPARSAAVPLVVRGRPVAVLYGDSGADGPSESEALFAMLGPIGSLGIEALGSARRGRGAGSSRSVVDRVAGSHATDGEQAAASVPASRPAFEDSTTDDSGLDPDEGLPAAAGGIAGTSPPAPEEAEMQALLGDIEGMRRESADGDLGPDDQRMRADARRFASLLISEILLYNEEAVILGRRNHDLSKRLAREIEKSRQAFATRVPAHIGSAGRYFDEELIRVLAEGDASVLGT